jgi:hypothetical protein
MQEMMDKDGNPIREKGKPKMEPVNEDRRAYSNAQFLTPRRLQMYKDLVLAAAEPMYIALWAIKIDCARWIDAELIISLDPYWSGVYEKEFGL